MEQEQKQVLSMLESGRITPEQADELLEALKPSADSPQQSVDLPSREPSEAVHFETKSVQGSVNASKKTPSSTRAGFSAKEIIDMGIHGVDPTYVRDMKKLFGDLSFKQVLELAIHNIKPAFVQEIRALGLDQLDFKAIVEMGIHGVDTQFVKDLRDQGLEDLGTKEIIEFAIHGLNADFVRKVQDLEGEFSDISAPEDDSDEAYLG